MHALVTGFSVVTSVIYALLALVAFVQWRRRRDVAAGWLALAFLTLGIIVTLGRLVPQHPHGFAEGVSQRVDIELLVLFPYLLYRFAVQFFPPTRRLQRVVLALTVGLSVGTFALPNFPAAGEPRPWWFNVYIVAFLVHWSLLSIVVTVRLWRAGRDQPGVAKNRMRLLALAAAALTAAIIGTAFQDDQDSAVALVTQILSLVAGVSFLLGIAPPAVVRISWRSQEQLRLQEAIRSLMTLATSRSEVADRVLAPASALVGARAAAIVDGEGNLLAARGVPEDGTAALGAGGRPAIGETEPLAIDAPGATLLVWTSPYAPFFGDEEMRALRTIAALTGVALDRVRLFEQEHDSRVALERTNEVMANFVALAAHELRTPVTTIHGFVQTLHHLGDRLDEEQQQELRTALEQQTRRMASLVEQLLDLSRLDAEAVEVRPQHVDLRERLTTVVSVAAGARVDEVELDVPDSLDATIDPSILDHIVTNLVTNAFRYGRAPVHVQARMVDGSVRVSVEDSGPGVAHELEDTLFERFTRAGVSRDRVAGTGLGLAIAQAYARAHRGDVRYERGTPSGARFVVELPSA